MIRINLPRYYMITFIHLNSMQQHIVSCGDNVWSHDVILVRRDNITIY